MQKEKKKRVRVKKKSQKKFESSKDESGSGIIGTFIEEAGITSILFLHSRHPRGSQYYVSGTGAGKTLWRPLLNPGCRSGPLQPVGWVTCRSPFTEPYPKKKKPNPPRVSAETGWVPAGVRYRSKVISGVQSHGQFISEPSPLLIPEAWVVVTKL